MGFIIETISAIALVFSFAYVTKNLIKEAKPSDIEGNIGGSNLHECKDKACDKIWDDESDDKSSTASNSDEGSIKENNSIEVNSKGENGTSSIIVTISPTESCNQQEYHENSDDLPNYRNNNDSIPLTSKIIECKDAEKMQCEFSDSICITDLNTKEFRKEPENSCTVKNSTCENIISDVPLRILPYISAITSNAKISPTNDSNTTEKASFDTEIENDKKNNLTTGKNENGRQRIFSSEVISEKYESIENNTLKQGQVLGRFSSNDADLNNLSKDIGFEKEAQEINAIKELDNDTISNYIYIGGKKKEVEMTVDGIVNPMVDENYRFNNEEIHNSSIEFNIDITSD
ncbi:hypothetical protein COBT_001353, partial [Conglomerata obtusa]